MQALRERQCAAHVAHQWRAPVDGRGPGRRRDGAPLPGSSRARRPSRVHAAAACARRARARRRLVPSPPRWRGRSRAPRLRPGPGAARGERPRRARGVEYEGSTDQVRARTQRAEPFGGYRHALAAAYGLTDPGECSALPHTAQSPRTRSPRGWCWARSPATPSRSYSAHAPRARHRGGRCPGRRSAIARVGARTFSEGGKVRHAPGRPLTELEKLELVRLVDAMEQLHPCALVSEAGEVASRVTRLAIEPLHPREAPGQRCASAASRASRRSTRRSCCWCGRARPSGASLEDRGLIPGFAEVEELEGGAAAGGRGRGWRATPRRRRAKGAAVMPRGSRRVAGHRQGAVGRALGCAVSARTAQRYAREERPTAEAPHPLPDRPAREWRAVRRSPRRRLRRVGGLVQGTGRRG